jgi:hypothetical protein
MLLFNNTLTGFTPFNSLQAMRIMQDVEMKLAGKTNNLANGFRYMIKQNTPYVECIKTIADCATDNYNMVADMIGCKLTDEILKFK